jgi:PAS domain S-box-containing protein/diguanylate cyclase (GGDEF)-like protein
MTELEDPGIFRTVLESLHTGVYLVGRDGKIRFWNAGAERITGYRRHEVIGRSRRDNILVHCDEHHCVLCGVACPLVDTGRDGQTGEAQLFFRHKAGHSVPVHVRFLPVRDQKGALVGHAESFEEQISVYEPETGQNNLAAHGCLDAITGVMTQGLTRSYLREHLAFFGEYDLSFGILSMRIRELEPFRTAHGREATDAILHVVAETVRHALGATGFLGRWAEDQFVAIVPNCSATELNKMGDNIRTAVNYSEVRWWGDLLSVTVSVEPVMVQPGDEIETLIGRVEQWAGAPPLQL